MRVAGCVALLCAARLAGAQAVPAPTPARTGPKPTRGLCDGEEIREIVVYASAPTVAGVRKIPVLRDVVQTVHTTTQAKVVLGFLQFHEGEKCTELKRAESERILRAQPFIADARVAALPLPDGGVRVEVYTSDEVSLLLGMRGGSKSPFLTGLRLGNSNLQGNAIRAEANWRHDGLLREGVGARVEDHLFLGRPNILAANITRDPLGGARQLSFTRPFFTDLQRVAWRAMAAASNDYPTFDEWNGDTHAVRMQRDFLDMGALARVGTPGQLALFGLSVTRDDERPYADPLIIDDDGVHVDTNPLLRGRYLTHRSARLNTLLGWRRIAFARVSGFDGLTATQDIPVGLQVGGLVGHSLKGLGADEADQLAAADLYSGRVWAHSALRIQLQGEARHTSETDAWDDILTSGRVAHYMQPSPGHLMLASLDWAAGWRQRSPFRLALGGGEGGLRGFDDARTIGGQRAVMRVEDRYAAPNLFGLGDLGLATFVDAGRVWASDVPFGRTSPVRASAGVSVLAAVPSKSGKTWRLDIALPINPENARRLEFRFSSLDRTTFFWREPGDVAGMRPRTVPSSLFSWP
ncbi:MAG: hypothetical protein JWO05_382 [Gemmatimonadetes bacterium]|nr:hypothetical protein [Gemmatimonadota bacterium]